MALTHNSKLADSEPSWGSVDKTKLPRNAHADMGEANKKSTWKYPHHWVQEGKDTNDDGVFDSGTMYLHKGGLNAAWAAAKGARSGKPASSAVKAHLRRHYSALGITKAEYEGEEFDITEFDEELIKAGYLSRLELAATTVQTLIFPKSHWDNSKDCKKWAKSHGFKSNRVDETGESYRLRQRDPGDFNQDSFQTICMKGSKDPKDVKCSVKAVIGTLSE